MVAVILLNTVALLRVARLPAGSTGYEIWQAIDVAAVAYFVLEAVLKLRRDGVHGYFASGWNRFDFVVVVLAAPSLLAPWLDLEQLGWVVVLRLGRLFRLFRLLRFIPDHEHLLDGVRRALKASVGVFLALLLANLILAIGGTLLFAELAPEYFGDPVLSLYTIFKVFTVEGWHEIPDLMAERAEHPGWAVGARLYFVVAVLVGGILGLSLANAVFVDEMMLDNTDELEERVAELTDEVRSLRRLIEDGAGAGEGDSQV